MSTDAPAPPPAPRPREQLPVPLFDGVVLAVRAHGSRIYLDLRDSARPSGWTPPPSAGASWPAKSCISPSSE